MPGGRQALATEEKAAPEASGGAAGAEQGAGRAEQGAGGASAGSEAEGAAEGADAEGNEAAPAVTPKVLKDLAYAFAPVARVYAYVPVVNALLPAHKDLVKIANKADEDEGGAEPPPLIVKLPSKKS